MEPAKGPQPRRIDLKRLEGLTADFKIDYLRAADDSLDLRFGTYYKGEGQPDRWLVFLNGRTEWIEKYAYLAADLNLPAKTGFLTWDHRGQGASGGARAFVADYHVYARDTQQVIAKVVGDKPFVVLAHSMGCLITLYSTLTGHLHPRALAFSAPLLGLPNDPVPRRLARPVANLLTLCQFGAVSSGAGSFTKIAFEQNKLTHDKDLYERMQAGPYPVPGASFGWVAATFRALDLCFDPLRLATLSAPTLVFGGSAEQVVDAAATPAWVKVAKQNAKTKVEFRPIAGAKHELLSEVPEYYDPVRREIEAWFAPHWGV